VIFNTISSNFKKQLAIINIFLIIVKNNSWSEMKLTMMDRSTYFKALLLLIKRDNIVTSEEKMLMTKIGKTLGFEKIFIESSINNLLENEFLTNDIPIFSNRLFAQSFILDGLKVAFSDDEFSAEELEHLVEIATKNGINREWLMELISKYIQHSETFDTDEFLFVTKYLNDNKNETMDIKT